MLSWGTSLLWYREDAEVAMGPFHSLCKLLSGLLTDAVGEAKLHQPIPLKGHRCHSCRSWSVGGWSLPGGFLVGHFPGLKNFLALEVACVQ